MKTPTDVIFLFSLLFSLFLVGGRSGFSLLKISRIPVPSLAMIAAMSPEHAPSVPVHDGALLCYPEAYKVK